MNRANAYGSTLDDSDEEDGTPVSGYGATYDGVDRVRGVGPIRSSLAMALTGSAMACVQAPRRTIVASGGMTRLTDIS